MLWLSSLMIPQFVFPFKVEHLNKTLKPKTNFSSSFTHRETTQFTQSTTNISYGYVWKDKMNGNHSWNIADYYSTLLLDLDSAYFALSLTDGSFDQNFDHVIPAGSYSYKFSNQNFNKNKNSKNFVFLRYNFEFSGNFAQLYNTSANSAKKP